MSPEDQERLNACINQAAEIMYANTERSRLRSLEDIEVEVRTQLQELVSPQIAFFLSNKKLELAGERNDS